MVTRSITFAEGEYYHVYNRGVDKRIIFTDQSDYKRFMELLYLANTTLPINVRDIYRDHISVYKFERNTQIVGIGAYCLMPNHFHLLITPLVENGLSIFMNKLSTAYSMYFNKKYERTGALFQGRYKAQHANDDKYLKYLFSYIHLNPVKLIQADWKENGITDYTKAKQYLADYQYSSYLECTGISRHESLILNRELFPNYFDTVEDAMGEVRDWLSFQSLA